VNGHLNDLPSGILEFDFRLVRALEDD